MAGRMMAIAAGLTVLSAANPIRAGDLEFLTGQDLYAQCSAKPTDADAPVRQAWCAAYVLGVSDAQQAAQGAGAPGRVCLPPATASAGKMADVVRAYLEANADKRPLAAKDLVIEALAAAYPCA